MKKIERFTLNFCYLFTLISVTRMCLALVSNIEYTFANVAQVVLMIGVFAFLFFMAGVLILSDRK
jgi:hypothetical protein